MAVMVSSLSNLLRTQKHGEHGEENGAQHRMRDDKLRKNQHRAA